MAVRPSSDDLGEHRKTDLSSFTYMDLVEMLVNENRTYRDNLSAVGTTEESLVPDITGERKRITDEYLQRIKPIKEEGAKREQLYLEVHKSNQGY